MEDQPWHKLGAAMASGTLTAMIHVKKTLLVALLAGVLAGLMACGQSRSQGPVRLVVPADFAHAYGVQPGDLTDVTPAADAGDTGQTVIAPRSRVVRVSDAQREQARRIVLGLPDEDEAEDPESDSTPDAFVAPNEGDTDWNADAQAGADQDQPETQAAGRSAAASNDEQESSALASRTQQAVERVAARSTPRPAGASERFIVDGMVGSVNGRPVYASVILEPVHDQLRALSQRRSLEEFRREATQLVGSRLEQFVTDTLIYGQAERDLSGDEQRAVRGMLSEYREELLRRYGQGSVLRAEQALLRQRGITLEQAVDQHRQSIIVRRYLQRTVSPRIVVTFRDIERFYRDNYEEFNPPAQRLIRLIVTQSDEARDIVVARLRGGEAFVEVAGDASVNFYKPDEQGLWGTLTEESPFGSDEANEALAKLRPGTHSEPIVVGRGTWILYLDQVEEAEGVSLRDAQLRIERFLREQQFRRLSGELRRDLFMKGSYNPLDQMLDALMDITLSRYAGQTMSESNADAPRRPRS